MGFCESPTAQKFDILNHRRWLSKQPSLFHYFQTPTPSLLRVIHLYSLISYLPFNLRWVSSRLIGYSKQNGDGSKATEGTIPSMYRGGWGRC